MTFSDAYRRQVALLVRTLPFVAPEDCFALKGGTAINFFIRDLPRLSVDIDLTYLPVRSYPDSLADIDAAMRRISDRIRAGVAGSQVTRQQSRDGFVTRLLVRADNRQIKIEVTPVLRGCVFQPQMRDVVPSVEREFGFAEMRIVSFADLYGGKIVAALDRQHPRDFFDVRDLLENEGIDQALRKAFIIYLLSHDRPMAEVLSARRKNIETEFRSGFTGMTKQPISLDVLLATRETLITEIVGRMPEIHRRFLLSFERGEPDWSLLSVEGASELPAVKWRQLNLDKLTSNARASLVANLNGILSNTP